MNEMISIGVARYDPEREGEPVVESYYVPMEEGATVMGALLYIYEHYDSTLAFRYACRNEDCGLCAMDINGRPRLACVTPLKKGAVIRPLQKMPVERDLIVNRSWIMAFLARFELFVKDTSAESWPQTVTVPEQYARLSSCIECMSCLAACPSYEHGREDRGGPYQFLKLALLHWDPRDSVDRRAQAVQLGVERCASCRKCTCPLGIPVYRMAVAPLSSGR